MTLAAHLKSLPSDLASALETEYRNLVDHFLKEEWDDTQVTAGRFSEAVLRVLEWHMTGTYTPIDGRSRPSRKKVVDAAVQDMKLPPTMRLQVPMAVELMMDFRNGRNAAHLGSIDPNRIDAGCVTELATWVMAELVRLETKQNPKDVQVLIDQLSDRLVPLVQTVGDRPIVLDPKMSAADRALVILYQRGGRPVASDQLRRWADYSNVSRWQKEVLKGLQKQKHVHVDEHDVVHLLRPGEQAAQKILVNAGLRVA